MRGRPVRLVRDRVAVPEVVATTVGLAHPEPAARRRVVELRGPQHGGDVIEADDLIFSPIETANMSQNVENDLRLSTIEKSTIVKVIEKHNGNITKAAKELGLTRTALYRKLSKHDI